ncbi:MAG TPA: CofH family radical SAM protein [Candidatus Thalassarchaeaceae archaeon]|nr:CofH family radical SAM protein [Candidatus Thalassarchaeaceae archaeon]
MASPHIANSVWCDRINTMELPLSVLGNELLMEALDSVMSGKRVTIELGVRLHNHAPLPGLAALAKLIKSSRYGDHVFFNENLHVNTTNICTLACRFCAFRRGSRNEEAYALSAEEFVSRIEPFAESIDEVHAVGGLHPEWTASDYAQLFRLTKDRFPHISIKSLTAVEIKHIASRSGLSTFETLRKLNQAGLDSLPGGGAEILVDSIRDRICRGKESSSDYLRIHGEAHELGMPTNCTMLFGTIESVENRITHLDLLRRQQDATRGFQCFVPYPFLPDKTRLPEANLATAEEIIRVISISRILLDNIPHIKAYRMNIGDHLATIAINSGADDIDGTVGHEEIMREAGSNTRADYRGDDLARLVSSSGLTPVLRNSDYSLLTEYYQSEAIKVRHLPIAG